MRDHTTTSVPFFENVTERIGEQIIASTVRPATEEEIAEAQSLHKEGRCPHTIIKDTAGWLYDERYCVTCDKFLGFI